MTSPANNATFTAPANITLTATAADSDGTIAKVEFFYGGTNLIATLTVPPYSIIWTGVPQGAYTLTAKAADNLNATTTSSPVNVTVGAAAASLYFIHTDHLNTPRVITNQAAQVVWRWDHAEPFGSNPPNENPSGLGIFTCNLRLPGQYFDQETNTHYNYFRDYDPAIGRYTQSDPVGLRGGVNTYAYVGSNPLSFTDLLGLESYQCRRPLGAAPGANQRSGPDVPGNPFYHQYSCTRDSKGNLVCGGQSTYDFSFFGLLLGSPGRPTTPQEDYFQADACRKSQDDNKCFEQCLTDEWNKPRPRYGIPIASDCQNFDDDVNLRCRRKCGLK